MRTQILQTVVLACLLLTFTNVHAQESFDSWCSKADLEVEKGNYKKALEFYDEALKIDSVDKEKMVWTATLASTCAMQIQDEHKAIELNTIAIKNGCTDLLLIDQQLELAKKYKKKETEEQVLLAARKIEGSYEKYTIKLLYFYYNGQQFHKTIVTANEVLKFNPSHSNSLYFKGVALSKTGNEEEAIFLFKELLNHDAENSKVNLQLGLIYFNRASVVFDKANQNYKSLVKPSRTDYHNYVQEIKKAEGDYKSCLPLLEQAYKTTPKDYMKNAIALTQGRLRQIEQE